MALTGYFGQPMYLEHFKAVSFEGRIQGVSIIEDEPITGTSEGSEEQLLAEAFKRGEPGAYEAIYARYQPRVTGVCRRMLRDPHDVDEAAQEAFLRVYQALPRFNGRYQLGAWIARITTNVCLDQLRAKSRRPSVPAPMEELDADSTPIEEGPEFWAIRHAESRSVRKVLGSLPPLHRAAIVLRDFEGLSYAEVASALEISEVQCKALIHRARQNFKRSWIPASVASFMPLRWVTGFKKVDSSVSHNANRLARHPQVAEVASSAGQAASACNTFLQTCGAAVTDRIAGTIAASVIALGSWAAGAQYAQHQGDTPQGRVVVPAIDDLDELAVKAVAAKSRGKHEGPKKGGAADQVVPTPETPDSTPEPQPSDPPDDNEPPETDGGTGGDQPDPEPSEAPQPWSASVGFFRDAVPANSVPSSNSVSLDCANHQFSQTMTIGVWDGDTLYPGELTLSAGSQAALGLRVTADKDYRYSSWGNAPAATWGDMEGDSMSLTITGEYGPLYGNDPGSANLPTSGHFEADLTLDCSTSRVVTESVILYMQ